MKPRDARLDALRGVFLVIMAGVHVPTPLSYFFQDPYGCNGAAEGFIFLSACLAGRVYGKYLQEAGWTVTSRRLWQRTRLTYIVHLGVLIPAALVAWMLAGKAPPLANHFADFLAHPLGSLALMPLLLHQPPLFDILPLYIIFLGVTPWLLALARRRGWGIILGISFLAWLAAQFKLDVRLIGDPARLLPLRWGAFNLAAWQFLWMCGAAMGEKSFRGPVIKPRYRAAAGIAGLMIVLSVLYFRWGVHGINSDIYLWMDKWTLGPLRLVAFGGWVALFLSWNPAAAVLDAHANRIAGRHSLGVFFLHLLLVIAATTTIQMLALSNALQTIVGFLVIALLFPWAAWLDYYKRAGSAAANQWNHGRDPRRMSNVPTRRMSREDEPTITR